MRQVTSLALETGPSLTPGPETPWRMPGGCIYCQWPTVTVGFEETFATKLRDHRVHDKVLQARDFPFEIHDQDLHGPPMKIWRAARQRGPF